MLKLKMAYFIYFYYWAQKCFLQRKIMSSQIGHASAKGEGCSQIHRSTAAKFYYKKTYTFFNPLMQDSFYF